MEMKEIRRLFPSVVLLGLLVTAGCQGSAAPAGPRGDRALGMAALPGTPATESPGGLPTPSPAATRIAEPTGEQGAAPAAQTVSGITLTAANPRLDGEHFRIDVCWDRPDNGNWLLSGGTLEIGGQALQGIQAQPIELRDWPVNGQQRVRHWVNGVTDESWEPAAPDAKGRRCDTLDYEVGTDSPGRAFILTFEALKNRNGTGAPRNGEVIEGPWIFAGDL